jgi:lycopene cyclase domain-containing protein
VNKFTYLFVDFGAVLVPFLFSFHPKINFFENKAAILRSLIIPAGIFIVWDIIFTFLSVWKFNSDYITGIYIFNLPIEEILFFICIPFSCLFTYYCISKFRNRYPKMDISWITFLIVTFLLVTGISYLKHIYTATTFIFLAMFLAFAAYAKKSKWLNDFYISYLLLLIPFLICNGILTGMGPDKPVVLYNEKGYIGILIGTIPIEDFFYGMLLILLNVYIFENARNSQL